MSDKTYTDELDAALARPDAERMCRQLDAYAAYIASDDGGDQTRDWPEVHADDFAEIGSSVDDDPDKAFSYLILADSRTDDAAFLGLLACGLLEDILRNPSDEMLGRIVAEARKSARFRWLLSNPFKVAVAPRAWAAIEKFRITGPHEEPSDDKLPLRRR